MDENKQKIQHFTNGGLKSVKCITYPAKVYRGELEEDSTKGEEHLNR